MSVEGVPVDLVGPQSSAKSTSQVQELPGDAHRGLFKIHHAHVTMASWVKQPKIDRRASLITGLSKAHHTNMLIETQVATKSETKVMKRCEPACPERNCDRCQSFNTVPMSVKRRIQARGSVPTATTRGSAQSRVDATSRRKCRHCMLEHGAWSNRCRPLEGKAADERKKHALEHVRINRFTPLPLCETT
jgi:hypothetical protein